MVEALPSKMRGAVLERFADSPEQERTPYVVRDDLPLPDVGPNDVLIQIKAAGYCHTEMMVVRGEFKHMSRKGLPLVPSHEPAGVVVALGEEATRRSASTPGTAGVPLRLGDRVGTTAFKDFCGKCEDCGLGRFKYCVDQDMCGVTANGAMAEYMAADYRSVVRLPDSLPFDAAAPLFCAGATIYTAIKACGLAAGKTLAIVGAGALGHLGCQMAKCLGLRTVVVDARDPPLELCKKLKYPPDVTINSSGVSPTNASGVQSLLRRIGGDGLGADATIVATDAIPAFELALELTRKHGTYVVVGQPQPPIPIPFHHLVFRDLTIKGSLLGDTADVKEMVDLVASHGIEVKTISYPLGDVHKLMADYGQPGHAGKMVVKVAE